MRAGSKSVLAWGEQIKKQTPEKPPLATQWENKFVLIWDEEGGFYFDGTYHPVPDYDPYSSCDFFMRDQSLISCR